MTDTDSPLKQLVRDFAPGFAAWLLNLNDAAIADVHPLNVELPAGALQSDTLFEASLRDGRRTLLHIEFQGRTGDRPMPLRMLDYMDRIAQRERPEMMCSVVLYVGVGAGARDSGEHRIVCHDGRVALAWRYQVIRLWELPAEELLALNRPALLSLVGQTRITAPEQVIPQVVTTIHRVPDLDLRGRLFAAKTGLISDQEVLQMAEQLIERMDRGLLMDTPLLRRIREEGRAEGRAGLVGATLDLLAARFEMPVATYRRIEKQIETIESLEHLRALLLQAVHTNDIAEFERALQNYLSSQSN